MSTNNLDSVKKTVYPGFIVSQESDMEKICRRCNQLKKITNFQCDKRREDGRTLTCRKCYTNNPSGKKAMPEDYVARAEKMRGQKRSIEFRLRQSKAQLKRVYEGIHQFISRESPDEDDFRMRLEYQLWRENVMKLKGSVCELCSSNNRIHVHHIKCYYEYPELRIDVNNGQVLCQSCHMKLTWAEKRKLGEPIHVNCKCPHHQKNNED